jgi:hypothetical protein
LSDEIGDRDGVVGGRVSHRQRWVVEKCIGVERYVVSCFDSVSWAATTG